MKREREMASQQTASLEERYRACMVLSGVGDALGYKNGEWEFCHTGKYIHDQLKSLGGIQNINIRGIEAYISMLYDARMVQYVCIKLPCMNGMFAQCTVGMGVPLLLA